MRMDCEVVEKLWRRWRDATQPETLDSVAEDLLGLSKAQVALFAAKVAKHIPSEVMSLVDLLHSLSQGSPEDSGSPP